MCGPRLFADQALPSALESIDMEVTGRVSSLPQRSADGVRFEFAVDSAVADGQALRVPSLLQLGRYSRAPLGTGPVWRAGDRWRLTVRLRRPHGNSNPHGFDRERWLWENGIGATGYVRNGPRDPRPVWLGASGWHPVEAARQGVSERIAAGVADPPSAGVLAALVVGDQSAIGHVLRQLRVEALNSLKPLKTLGSGKWLRCRVTNVL